MKVMRFAALMALAFICGLASAQNYSIRVAFDTNLRAAASLQARIVETAPAGTVLNVVGSDNRWLRVNRKGSEVYMADWVDYTRVEGGSQAQISSQIDNCCFVDRQCHSDQPPEGISYDVHTTHNAAMLVHEACHVYRYEAGLESGGLAGETACVQTEIQALQAINPDSSWISFAQTVLANIHRPECQWWWGEYKACG